MQLPWITASVLSVLFVAAAVLDARSGHGSGAALVAAWSVITLVPTAFGLLILTRRQGHPIGWLLLAVAAIVLCARRAGAGRVMATAAIVLAGLCLAQMAIYTIVSSMS